MAQDEKEEAALAEFRKRLELKPDVEKQLRVGGEPGMLSDVDPNFCIGFVALQ